MKQTGTSFWGRKDPLGIVYSLFDPTTQEYFYVGQAKDYYARFIQHIRLDDDNEAKTARIRSLKKRGLMPVMQTEWVGYSEGELDFREAFFIEYYRTAGHPLTNKILPLGYHGEQGRIAYLLEKAEEAVAGYPTKWLRRFMLKRKRENLRWAL